jgi:hypothetical protein
VSVAARQLEGELAALRLGPAPLVQAGFEQMEFRFTDRSLKPQQKAIIQRIRVVDPLRVAEQRIAKRTDLEQLSQQERARRDISTPSTTPTRPSPTSATRR